MTNRNGFIYENPYEERSVEWITPPWIIDEFNSIVGGDYFFDLDPCASTIQPWRCARECYTIKDNGLKQKWYSNVWMNPPYGGNNAKPWVRKMCEHKNGIVLLFARVETLIWQDYIFKTADSFLFIKGRLRFAYPSGQFPPRGKTAGAPSVLIAWGNENKDALFQLQSNKRIQGAFLINTK